jgi:hypothetical protein
MINVSDLTLMLISMGILIALGIYSKVTGW